MDSTDGKRDGMEDHPDHWTEWTIHVPANEVVSIRCLDCDVELSIELAKWTDEDSAFMRGHTECSDDSVWDTGGKLTFLKRVSAVCTAADYYASVCLETGSPDEPST